MKIKKLLPLLLILALAWLNQILAAQSALFDDSNGPFTILAQAVTVLTPNGGENWKGGETHDITWSMVSSAIIAKIEYSTDSGSSWSLVAADTENDGTYSWMVPNILSSTCLVRISDATNAATNDTSDAVFTIEVGSETISAPSMPTGPTTWTANTSYDFSTGGSVSSAGHSIQYKFDWGDGSDSGWLTTGTTGIDHAWTFSGTYQVRAKARCVTHTTIESPWSETLSIIISAGNAPVLQWNTFLGSNESDQAHSIAVDGSGNIFISGVSGSTWGNPLNPYGGGYGDGFVAKLNASGILQWNTFLGNKSTGTNIIIVDNSGNIFVIGVSNTTWGSPINPYSGNVDTFVAKLNASGIYQWHTFLGGSGNDGGYGIALDASGNIFITGESSATWGSPLNPFSDQIPGYGNKDIFAAKLNAGGVLQWNTFMGGSYDDIGRGITIDNSGNIYIAGTSDISLEKGDAFVAKLNANGALQWQTLLGGINDDNGCGIALDGSGNIFVAGNSYSTWGTPLHNFSTIVGNVDTFVAKLNQSGTLQWHTFNDGPSWCTGIALDNSGNIFVTGVSGYSWGIPINPFSGYFDTFVVKLNASGARQWHTFVGGNSDDQGQGIAADNNGNVYVTGYSTSNWGRPLRPYSALNDAFVAKLGISSSTLTVTSPNGGENWAAGSSRNITWSSSGTIANVNIDYSTDNGSSWTPVVANIANSWFYAWTVPATLSTACLVRVSDAGNATVFDVNDTVFTISALATIIVTTPNGGENWTMGSSRNIIWNSPGTIANVNIDYSTDSGSNWNQLTINTINSGTYAWTVPVTASTNCLVRVSDAVNASTYDISDMVFSISSASAETITTPNQPTGPASGTTGNSYQFSSGGANSNYGDALQYRFDWGYDSDSGWLAPGTTSAVHSWEVSGTYQVRAMARCATHTGVESPWSETHSITITGSSTGFFNLHEFVGGDADGSYPRGSLILSGSTLFGMTAVGGDSNKGTIFKIEINGTGFTLLHEFVGGTADGANPYGDLIISGTTLYGMTQYGGDGDLGTIFKIETNGTGFTLLHEFAGGTDDGANPLGSLILSGSTLYGMTQYGGESTLGTIFKIQTDGAGFTLLHEFAGGTEDGANPSGSPILSGTTIYGMTPDGGDSDLGTIFMIETNGTGFTLLHKFAESSGNGSDPFGSLILSGSTLYGMTKSGYYKKGTIFNIQTNGTGFTLLHEFPWSGSDGEYPNGSLILSGSTLFGMTPGYYIKGTIFKMKTNGSGFSLLHNFAGGAGNGLKPYGSLIFSGLILYGMTESGGESGAGVIFSLPLSTSNSITVTSPIGGENWTVGSSQSITWNEPGTIANVNIDYSIDNGSNWTLVAAGITNTGSYTWTVPNTLSTDCLVRVSDAFDPSASDCSDAVFSIYLPTTLTISGTVTFEGSPLKNVIMNGLPGNPVTDSSGFYTATVDYGWSGTVTPSVLYCTFTPASTTYTGIASDQVTNYIASLTQSLVVTSPVSGASWQRGMTYPITWLKQGEQNAYVKIQLYKGTSTLVKTLTSKTDNNGYFDWFVPVSLAAGSTYFIKVKTIDNLIYDDSDKFSIIVPTIAITAPATGSTWIRGTTKSITWTWQGTVNAGVKIQLYKGTAKALDITTSTPTADGSFTWNIPATLALASNYSIKITALDNLVTGKSGKFSIMAGVITVTAPVAGMKWQRGVAQTITWTGEGALNANVKIQLLKGTKVNSTIAATTPNDGSFEWTVPASQTLAANYKIRVRTVDNLVTGISGAFAITNTSGLTLQAPNGNERLTVRSTYPIRWAVDPSMNEVKLEYSRDNGGTFFTIADHVPNSGQYAWRVPVNFTFKGIVRISDSVGKNWLEEEGVLECLFKFNCRSQQEARQPDFAVWFGPVKIKAPGCGFARVAIGRDMVRMAETSQAMAPLSSGWHEAKIRLDLKRDLGTLFIDNQRLLENVALYTSLDHHFEPHLSIQTENSAAVDLLLAELTVQVTLLSVEGNEKESFTILSEDFSGYDVERNVIGNCWQASGLKTDGPALNFKALPGMGQALRLQSAAGARITISKPLAIPENIPFDISDRSFIIEMRQGDD